MGADTFGIGIHLTDDELQFVVRVPSDIDSGWADPSEFQTLVAEVVWSRLDKRPVLESIATAHDTGDTVSIGTVTLEPDGTVVTTSLREEFLDTTLNAEGGDTADDRDGDGDQSS
ncbi:hypothetical protein JCM18237_11770 [Halorubrum luteum]